MSTTDPTWAIQILNEIRRHLKSGAIIHASDISKPVLEPMEDGSCMGGLTISFPPNVPMHALPNIAAAAHALCQAIELFPASSEQTVASLRAADLAKRIDDLANGTALPTVPPVAEPPAQSWASVDEEARNIHRMANTERAKEFVKELERLVNSKSLENGSNTPDFLIAEFLGLVLAAFDTTVNAREKWYGRGQEQQKAPILG